MKIYNKCNNPIQVKVAGQTHAFRPGAVTDFPDSGIEELKKKASRMFSSGILQEFQVPQESAPPDGGNDPGANNPDPGGKKPDPGAKKPPAKSSAK